MDTATDAVHPGARVDGRKRSILFVILLTLFTLGIYALYWYWINLVEMEGAVDEAGRKTIRYAKRSFLVLMGLFAVVFIWALYAAEWSWTGAMGGGTFDTTSVLFILPFDILFTVLFLKSIQITQQQNGIAGMPFGGLLGLYFAQTLLNLLERAFELQDVGIIIIGILRIILTFLFLALMQVQINRVWQPAENPAKMA